MRERLSLDRGWLFHLGDIPMPLISGHLPSYMNAKAGQAWGAADPNYDDTDWRRLNLPHDWVVEGPFEEHANISQGYRPRGVAWYRRHFRLEESENGRHFELQFDGIASHATVWVNGLLLHRNHCGYTPFQIDLSPLVTFGDRINTIAVRVDADVMEGWWYEGGGIYRHTWLVKRSEVHIPTYGLRAIPRFDGRWALPVRVEMENIGMAPHSVEVVVDLLDPAGDVMASASAGSEVDTMEHGVVEMLLKPGVAPHLWSLDNPFLYRVRAQILCGGRVVDEETVPCGFRTIRFDADKGFFLNDQPVKLQGTCNHQDHAGVGVAVPDAIWEFRIRRLKEMGSNAYRCAHNPPAPEFLDVCDRLGMLVMDENRHFNHAAECREQLAHMVRRDRHHPSVILWSVFNEEPMQATGQGREMVRRMAAEVRRWDDSRPVTAAINGGFLNDHGVFEAVDVMGFNYTQYAYDVFHEKHPTLPITSAEDTAAFMTRGEFESDPARNVVASYDDEVSGWGLNHREGWKVIAERPHIAGGFVWTGFDYRGEPQRLVWPSVSSIFGIMDTCGFPKVAFFIRQSQWVKDRPILALAPHWNWPGREGQPVRVIAMTNAGKVALFLNGRALGEKAVPAYDYAEWQVPYEPGVLEAVALEGGSEIARTHVETTGEPVAIRVRPDRDAILGDGHDTTTVEISAVDAAGRVVPGASAGVTFHLTGAAENIGHGNGDHNCHDPEKGPYRKLFHGLAQLIVQSTEEGEGEVLIRAESPGLEAGTARLAVRRVAPVPSQAEARRAFSLEAWRMSPPSVDRPDPAQEMSEEDMNTWAAVVPGQSHRVPSGSWVLLRTSFVPWKKFWNSGGWVELVGLCGSAELWLDGNLVAKKMESAPGPVGCAVPAMESRRVFTLVLRAGAEESVGVLGSAVIR